MTGERDYVGELIEAARSDLAALLDDKTSFRACLPTTRGFMARVYDLGMELRRRPALHDDPRVKDFLAWAGTETAWVWGHLNQFLLWLEDKYLTSSEYGEWVGGCYTRSEAEFFKELLAADLSFDLNRDFAKSVAELDERYKQRMDAGYVGHAPYDEIPDGIPASHWWWWYPARSYDELARSITLKHRINISQP